MDVDSLLAFVRFHAWANDRILTTAAGLRDEEFRRETVLDHGSAFQTLRHLVDVDWSWRELCIGNDVGQTYVWDHGFELDDLPAIHAFCLAEDTRLRSYVESLNDRALTESVALGSDPNDVVRWSGRATHDPIGLRSSRTRDRPETGLRSPTCIDSCWTYRASNR
jgi:uncharacterized damage-inducible protein DinB